MASDYDGWQSNILLDALRYVIQECKAIKQSPIKFCFFIDGLDELEEFKSQDETHTDLVKTLKDLSELPGVKLCISSRPYHAFRTGFEDAAGTLKLEDLTRNDMLQYAKSQLDKNEKFRNLYKSSREYQGFIREISIRAEGVFLWVRLVTRDLLNLAFPDSDTIGTLYRRLGKCPVDLDDFFDKTIQRIDPRNLPQAARIFWLASHVDEPLPLMVYWLLCELPYGLKSFQPQSLGSTIMSDAEVSTRSEEMRALLDQCSRGLLEIVDGERGTGRFFELKVDFIHRSVRDFLRQPDASGTVFQGHKFIGFQNNERLVPCVALLAAMKRAPFSRPVTAAAEMLLKQLVLFAQDAQENMSGDSADLVTVLHETEKAYLTAREKFQLKSDSNLLLGLACQANLFDYVKTKAEKELRVAPSKFARPPLSYALQTSPLMQRLDPLDFQIHLRIVKLLLDKGADPHRWHPGTTPPWNGFISSVLQNPDIATSKGVLDAISYLVSRDVDTSMKFNPLSYDEGVHQLYYSPGKPKSTHEPVPTVGDEIKKLAQRLQVKISYPEPQSEPLHVAMQGKRIVVVGAGIAGLAFVIGLRKYWPAALIPPKIALYDWSIPGRPDNAGNYSVYLSGPHEVGAHNVLKDLGLLDEALRCAVTDKEEAPNDYFAHFTGSIFGGTDAKVGLQSPGADAVTVEQYRIPHESVTTEAAVGSRRISYWDLHRIMLEAVEKTDEVFWEVNCQNVVAREDGKLGVWLTGGDFEGGHLSLCDLVVAADGVSSTVKACLQSRSRPMMADYQVGGIATFPDGIPPSLRTWGTRSAQDWFLAFPFCSYTTTDEIHVIWDLNSSDRLGVDHLSEPKKLLEACHDGIDELPESKVKQLQTLINATHTTAVSFFDRKTKNQVLNRSNKNIVFVGDSNYPFGSRAGDGGSLALMDGWDLAKRLTEATELTAAIDAYQKDSVSRATNLLKFWGQDALYGGVQVVSFVFTALKQLGNMFLIFLKK
jgi:2-polyprenyl-6-methoxyphenol hydroxylase-like FAD-dependent oxidoreductase